jgi:tryptophan halogenase
MKKRIAVVGSGTAGLVSIAGLLPHLPSEVWEIVSIHDPKIAILGIGESTNPQFIDLLQASSMFTIEDLPEVDGTLKFGTKYEGWRREDFVNPLYGSGYAIHFNNFKLKEFLFKRFHELASDKFSEMHGTVSDIIPGEDSAQVVIDGKVEEFEYVIDCRGFPTSFIDYEISKCSPVNQSLVYSVPPVNQEMYTGHIAMEHGWMFRVPLTTRTTYGYMFNNEISDKEVVVKDLEKYLDVEIDPAKLVDYKFKSYYAKQIYSDRVLKNGNRAIFFEPLSANSIYMYIHIIGLFKRFIGRELPPRIMNEKFRQQARGLEDMLSYIYHGGSNFDTEFWHYVKSISGPRLKNSTIFPDIVKEYKALAAAGFYSSGSDWIFGSTLLRIVDKNMGYNYFSKD